MNLPIRVLLVEDSEDDALLLIRHLRRAGYRVTFDRVDTAEGMEAALARQSWDAIIADYSMPHFGIPEAMAMLEDRDIDIPFIIVSGTIGEETAVDCMRAGAHDYIMKSNLMRLAPAMERELAEAQERRRREQAEAALRESEDRYRALFAGAANPIMILDGEGYFITCNDAALRFFGIPQEEQGNRSIREFMAPVPDQTPPIHGEAEPGELPWAGEGAVSVRVISPFGVALDVVVTPTTWRGKRMLLGIGKAATKGAPTDDPQHATVVRYRDLYENAVVGLLRARVPDLRILECNHWLAVMFGYDSREELAAQFHLRERCVDQEGLERILANLGERGEVRYTEVHLTRKDGSVFWGSISARLSSDRTYIDAAVVDVVEDRRPGRGGIRVGIAPTHPL